jgi:hypothetical protein
MLNNLAMKTLKAWLSHDPILLIPLIKISGEDYLIQFIRQQFVLLYSEGAGHAPLFTCICVVAQFMENSNTELLRFWQFGDGAQYGLSLHAGKENRVDISAIL